jgi:hypothetical protein
MNSRISEGLATGAMSLLVALFTEYAGTDGMLRYERSTKGNESAMRLARRIDYSIDTWPKKILLVGVKGAAKHYVMNGGIE